MDQLKQLFASLSIRQRIGIAVAAIAVIAGLTSFMSWNNERNFKPLYTDLSAEDAGVVLTRLKESGTEYRVTGNGSTVMVPVARVAELRLQLAAAGHLQRDLESVGAIRVLAFGGMTFCVRE